MTIKQAIKILEKHNLWRRGEEVKMLAPEQIGKAIDVLLVVANEYIKLYDLDRVKVTPKKQHK